MKERKAKVSKKEYSDEETCLQMNMDKQSSVSLSDACVTSLASRPSSQQSMDQDAVPESKISCISESASASTSASTSSMDTSAASQSRLGATTPPEVPSSSTSSDNLVIVKQERIKAEDEGHGSSYSQIEEFISSTEAGYEHCEFHSAELLEKNMVCMICKKLICGLCLAQKHMGHHILSINKIRETKNIRDSLNGDLSRLQCLQQNLTERFKERRLLRDSIKQSTNTLLNNIDKAFQQLQDILENKHQEVVNHVKRFERSNVEEVSKNLEVIKSLEQLATKTIISVEKFFDRLDVQSASLLPERLKEVLEHVSKNHFVPIENKEKYLPEVKFAKFISSIEAVSSICKTIHPEASKVVWSKVTPESKGNKPKQSNNQAEQQTTEEKKEDIKEKCDNSTGDSSKGKRKLDDSVEDSPFKKPRTETSSSPNISSTVSSEGEILASQIPKESLKQGKTRVTESVFERMLNSTQEWKSSLDSNVVGHTASEDESDSTDTSSSASKNSSKKKVKANPSKNPSSSPSSALRETRSTASPLKIKTEILDQNESVQQQSISNEKSNTEDVGVDPYRDIDTSETEDEDEDLPPLKHVKFNMQKMPAGCCVLVKGPEKVPWLGKVTSTNRQKETFVLVVQWMKGKIGDKKFQISDRWHKKGDKMNIDCTIAYFNFNLDEEMSDELIEELKVAQSQCTFGERMKTKLQKEKQKDKGLPREKTKSSTKLPSKLVLKPALMSPSATAASSSSQSSKKPNPLSKKSSSSSSKSKSSPSPSHSKSAKSKKSGKT